MESRKVQRVGYSTFSVSLPKDWVNASGIRQGDLIMFLPEKDGSLKLMPSSIMKPKMQTQEFVIKSDLCNDPGMLERIIVGNYILGRDTFRVISSNRISREQVEEVRRIVHRLMGLGIVQETPERIDLQCSIDPTSFKIDMLMRRLSVIASTMNVEGMQALTEANRELAQDAILREDEADMMYWLAIRMLLSAQRDRTIADKIGLEESSDIIYYAQIAIWLELIADNSEDIARRAIEFHTHGKEKVSKQVMNRVTNIAELTHNVFLKGMDCVFTRDVDVGNNILEMVKVIENEHERLMKELPELPILRTILLDLARIATDGAGIAVIAINRALEKPSKMCS